MNEEKHVLAKLENIYFGKKENEKLTMHEIGVVLDYVALLEQKSKQLQQKENIIKEVREYIKNNSLYEQDYDYDYEENLVEYPPSDEQARKDILEILDKGE